MRKKKQEEHMDESWLIPYADILTLLLALFLVLYAMSSVNEQKFQELKESLNTVFAGSNGILVDDNGITEDLDNISNQNYLLENNTLKNCQYRMTKDFEEMGISHMVSTKMTDKGLLITIQDIALFDSGKAELRRESIKLLKYIGLILAEIDNDIQVGGHTDNLPINTEEFPSNWELSTQRALNVMKKLLDNPELKANRFSVVGYGEYKPIATNETAEGRAQNRRVELLIVRNYTNLNLNNNL